ncbi:MAG: hypothetical protein ABFD18_15925 [Syntrophomonas sp.]
MGGNGTIYMTHKPLLLTSRGSGCWSKNSVIKGVQISSLGRPGLTIETAAAEGSKRAARGRSFCFHVWGSKGTAARGRSFCFHV